MPRRKKQRINGRFPGGPGKNACKVRFAVVYLPLTKTTRLRVAEKIIIWELRSDMDSPFSFLEKIGPEPNNLIKGLQLIQSAEGYVSDDAIKAASAYFGVPAAEIEGVLTFYAQFKRVKPGKFKIAVCDGTACHIKGAPQVHEWLRQEIGLVPGETSPDGVFSLETVACLGCCSLAPVMSVNGKVHAKLDRKSLKKILGEYAQK